MIPAEYKEVSKQVCCKPASCSYESIPAVYEDRECKVCTCGESKRKIEIPAKYETRTHEVQTCGVRKVWRKTECNATVTPAAAPAK